MDNTFAGKEGSYDWLLVDGTNLVHRPWFVQKLRLGDEDKIDPLDVVDTFERMILGWQQTVGIATKRIVVAFDSPGSSGRKELYAGYKNGRGERHPGLKEVLNRAPHNAARRGFKTVEVGGYEADDILATYARLLALDGQRCLSLSSDKDMLQAVTEDLHAIVLGHKAGEYKIFDPARVAEDYGFPPELMADYKALMGDKSDAIPGVKNVGEVAAKKLLGGVGPLQSVYQALGDWDVVDGYNLTQKKKDRRVGPYPDIFKPALRASLNEGRADAFLYLALTRLNSRVPGL